MKGWEIKDNKVTRKGELIATVTESGSIEMEEGKKNFTNMVKKVLKEADIEVEAPVKAKTPEKKEKPVKEIPDVEEMEPVKPAKREFTLPPDVRLEAPPKEKVAPHHKATLYFTKNGVQRKCALDHVPDSEGILTFIEGFKHP